MEKENIGLKGKFHIALIRGGQVIDERDSENTVTAAGKAQVAGILVTDIGGVPFDYLAIGTGTAAPSTANTTLAGEKYRGAATGSRVTTTVPNDTARLTASFAITASNNIAETGILNSSSAGVLLARGTFSALTCSSSDTVNIGYDVAIA
jgi:hypothetical protein